jgi:tetratricopeptide (TPR) repeat protein
MSVKFGWSGSQRAKRQKLSAPHELQAELTANLEADEERERNAYDEWMRRQSSNVLCLEDSSSLSLRKQEEGCTLAEAGRFRDAISLWQQAIDLTPQRAVLFELQAQAWMELGQAFDAVKCAEHAVNLDPMWPEAYVTLARARLNFGEVELGYACLQKAVTIAPSLDISSDLQWATELMAMRERLIQDAICSGNVLAAAPHANVLAERPLMRMAVGDRVCLSVPITTTAAAQPCPGLSLHGLIPRRRPTAAHAATPAGASRPEPVAGGWGELEPPPSSSSSSRTPSPPPA